MKKPNPSSRRTFIKRSIRNSALIGGGSILPFSTIGMDTNPDLSNPQAPRLPLKIWLNTGLVQEKQEQIKKISPDITLYSDLDAAEKDKLLPEIDVVFGRISEEDLAKAKGLKWVHSSSAGVEKQLFPSMMERSEIAMSNAKGCYGPAIAEHVFGLLFSLTRGIKEQSLNMSDGNWKGVEGQIEMRNLTMGIIGYGGIGREIARRAKAMDLKVLAADIRPMTQESTGNIVDELYEMEFGGFEKVLENSNILVSAVPHTAKTEGMFNEAIFNQLPNGSYFINISRGKVTNTDDLMKTLDSGRLSGAGLDVTDPEPLPQNHPLWQYPNVIITSHISGRSQYSHLRSQDVFVRNVERWVQNMPLLHEVDKEAGF
ncbi:D-2-hydroxyacid dehydrogenase [Pleomorphovibrio marinus]|uniref:D-2-hydroxyacid dehydrogenase n=1 Tax=Pleomorphovibrio marinus TaxID=2164132 RepID=UPI000E0AE901|nr:D-2-hydroxyacid dehydrogenase [Pleomorphovibrio marinus]